MNTPSPVAKLEGECSLQLNCPGGCRSFPVSLLLMLAPVQTSLQISFCA